MKSFIVAILIAISMITGSIIYTESLENISSELLATNRQLTEFLENENYEEALNTVSFMKDYINDKKILLTATGDHAEVDRLEIYLSELTEYIKGEHLFDALAHSKALKTLFEHLPKNYRIKAENIL